MAQSVERRIGSAEVTGPIPVSSLWIAWYLPGFFSFCAALVYTYETVRGASGPCHLPILRQGIYNGYGFYVVGILYGRNFKG